MDFHSIFFPTIEVNAYQQLFGYERSSKYRLVCSCGGKLEGEWMITEFSFLSENVYCHLILFYTEERNPYRFWRHEHKYMFFM